VSERAGSESDRAPLAGITAIVTRAVEQSDGLREALEALGASVIVSPSIRFTDPLSWAPLDLALARIREYDWAIFTSVNGVAAVDRRLAALGKSWRIFEGVRLLPIGPQTAAELRGKGLAVDRMPQEYQAEGILAAIEGESLAGRRILLARAERAREVLPEQLRSRGAEVDVVTVYRTLPAAPDRSALRVLRGRPGKNVIVTFTSSSTVEYFLAQLPADARAGLDTVTIAAIGPITAATLQRQGLFPDVQPAEFTVLALVDVVRDHYRRLDP